MSIVSATIGVYQYDELIQISACGVSIAGAVYRFKDELALQPDYTWDGVYIQSFGCVAQHICAMNLAVLTSFSLILGLSSSVLASFVVVYQ